MNIFDKTEKDFDEDGILRAIQPEEPQQEERQPFVPCECVWEDTINDFSELCENHTNHISNLHDTIEVHEMYKATSDENEVVYVVAKTFNEAVEMAEIYFEEEDDEELREIKAAHTALIRR